MEEHDPKRLKISHDHYDGRHNSCDSKIDTKTCQALHDDADDDDSAILLPVSSTIMNEKVELHEVPNTVSPTSSTVSISPPPTKFAIGSTTVSFLDVPSDVFQQYICPFIGMHRYLFMASINQLFKEEYTSFIMSPKPIRSSNSRNIGESSSKYGTHKATTTYVSCKSLEQTMFCYREIDQNDDNIEKLEIELCKHATASGIIQSIQYLHSMNCYWDHFSICNAAAKSGSLLMLQYLHDHGCPWDTSSICSYAAQSGNLPMLLYLHREDHKCKWNSLTCRNAALCGHLHIVQYLIEKKYEWNFETILGAAQCGHLEILDYLYQRSIQKLYRNFWKMCPYASAYMYSRSKYSDRSEWCDVRPTTEKDYLLVIQWYHAKFPDRIFQATAPNADTFDAAAKFGHLQILQYLYDHVGIRTFTKVTSTCREVAKSGHLHVLQWVKQNLHHGIQFDKKDEPVICAELALHGNLDVLQYLRVQKNIRWSNETCANAAKNGHFHILQYVRQQECPWNWKTCSHAALNGHLHILQWARQNNCPWSESTCLSAAENGHLEILQWARNNGCKFISDNVCSRAAMFGQLNVLKWANTSNSWFGSKVNKSVGKVKQMNILYRACEYGNLDMVEYLIEECGADPNLVNHDVRMTPLQIACSKGHLNVVKYIMNITFVKTTSNRSLIDSACYYGYFKIVQALHNEGQSQTSDSLNFKVSDHVIKQASCHGYYKIIQFLAESCNCNKALRYDTDAESHGHQFLSNYLKQKKSEMQANGTWIQDEYSDSDWDDDDDEEDIYLFDSDDEYRYMRRRRRYYDTNSSDSEMYEYD